uniref:hypothetical protein n=1 Tax=Pseudomonas sp. TaxID=306 RepID=UPI0010B8FA12|nr:hypothetical protein [Pseudomonas sp.]QBM91802.1 hypothetical protein pA46H2_p04 [Pseudomonas sp.]
MSLPITARQMNALRALQQHHPDLGELATAVALAFDASKVDNPELARLILENTCRRILTQQAGSHEVLIQHLQHFATLECLSVEQVSEFIERIRRLV